MRADFGEQFPRIDGFAEVADCPHLPASLFFRLFGLCAEKNHGNRPRDLGELEPTAYFESINVGHHDVEQNQVRLRIAGGDREGPFSGRR